MRRLLLFAVLLGALVSAAPAGAITFGQLDGNRHPWVGALFADWDPDVPGPDLLCSGTLISPTVFLTASHCTAFLEDEGISAGDVSVSFDPQPSNADGGALPSATLLPGTYHTHPLYGPGHNNDPHDIAVVVLDHPYTATAPAQLPSANYLNTLALKGRRFTAVGYGTVREIKQTGPNAFFFDGKRRFVDQGFNSLTPYWLKLDMNPSTGSGGTCYGDSGGPHFLGDTKLVVSITITGDTACRSTDATYRVDTPSARAFLSQYVALP